MLRRVSQTPLLALPARRIFDDVGFKFVRQSLPSPAPKLGAVCTQSLDTKYAATFS